MKKHSQLFTKGFKKLDHNNPLSEYPYPNFMRDSFFSLNGKWKFKISKSIDFNNINNEITVPFAIESFASGVNVSLKKDEYIIYKKEFTLTKDFIKEKTFINFIGVDQKFILIINDYRYEEVIPLCLPVKIDITNHVKEYNIIYVIVKDNVDTNYPIGKQNKRPRNIFYTPFSGIYYPVFISSYNSDYIESININTTCDTIKLDINSESDFFNIIIKANEDVIYSSITHNKSNVINIANPILWDCDNPFLYKLIIKTRTDEITSYFGLRTINIINDKFYLNNKKIFLNGLLYQGYYPDSGPTPISYQTIEEDILLMKDLGYNTIRVHIKIECPYFYYLCDKHGLLVLQDFVNSGKYHFLTQTAFPTIGLLKRSDKNMNKNKLQREMFIKCGENLVSYLSNHPSVIGYTIFNEAWGQFDADNVYKHFKNLYPDIIFNSVSGWFIQKESDITGLHLYFNNLNKLKTLTKPVLLSEFGALCYKTPNHHYSEKKVFAYKYLKSINDLEHAYTKLFENQIIPYKDNLSGIIYTQFNDVEEEDNGLITFDRKTLKMNKELIIKINKKLREQ